MYVDIYLKNVLVLIRPDKNKDLRPTFIICDIGLSFN